MLADLQARKERLRSHQQQQEVTQLVFDGAAWQTAPPLPPTEEPDVLKFITFNIDCTPPLREERAQALSLLIGGLNPDIIALQECTPPALSCLMATPAVRRYHFLSVPVSGAEGFMVGMLSRWPLSDPRVVDLEGRPALTASLNVRKSDNTTYPIGIGCVHLISGNNPFRREQQIKSMATRLECFEHNFVMGDFNACIPEEDSLSVQKVGYDDAWVTLHGKAPGATGFGHRLDKVIFKSAAWLPLTIDIVGNTPVTAPGTAKPFFISDHFGLCCSFKRRRI
ncbi:endonuclease/exonuclease/phosphatase family protein [Pelomyxa schiedti]|nr:endonuclease/exonuclease/phosphatase family protein [Pelomyxa schiedti]